MLARVYPGKEVVIASANAKVVDGMLVDEDVLTFAVAELMPFIESLE